MKKIHLLYIVCALSAASLYSCDDFLNRDPQNKQTNDTFWVNETSLRTYAQDFYSTYYTGYGIDYTIFGGYFSGDDFTDDFLTLSGGTRNFPLSPTAGINATTSPWWSNTTGYSIVYKANVMLEKIPGMNISDEAKAHWTGIARYFRAMTYSAMTKIYGGVPYIDSVTDPADSPTLYKDRDPYLFVAQKILEDYQYALANVRTDDTKRQVNKYVVGAYMSRDMLYHATWLKYHGTTVGPNSDDVAEADLKALFQGAIDGAEVVMAGPFAIGNDYNAIFASDDLAGNREVIFYREYTTGLQGNALMSYNADFTQEQGGVTENVIESFLCSDGLPIGQSPLYEGADDPSIKNSFKNRDPRLYVTIVDSLRILYGGLSTIGLSPTGYPPKKFLNEQWLADGSPFTRNNQSPADAPTIRFAEVLLNYAEARYEISKVGGNAFTQADLDRSINLIRGRKLLKWGENPQVERTMPAMTLSGNNISVGGTVINDPARDNTVDAVLWEIRRERRVELLMEGRRGEDLRRWAKYEYLNSEDENGNPDKTFLGAYVKLSDYPGLITGETGVHLFNPADPTNPEPEEGYIWHLNQKNVRVFKKGELDSERYYLRSIPATQITMYKDNGYTLTQNPGWE
ncbi:RagB/SusD family nutrient uptake outer membrane protein [Bacteroides sp. UBA939]|uniref:RagB/SusD family nutrient uptake outer membrane protein n=1 Tax=Bacteroides sp. UBA939 TaxID=1946092 RepID=UPI0025C10B1F|nr:RagB/SusD family nutrient uptake outer membrane protein [Bacteroides sp. UBA939]